MTTTVPTRAAGPVRTALTDWTLHVRGSLGAVPEGVRPALRDGLPVQVPTTALAALVRAGLAGDVTVDATEEDVAWVAATPWELRTRVPRPARATRARLVLEGVDTVGRVVVDGAVRLEVSDMFRRHAVELDPAAGPDADHWDVRVELDPALPVAQAAEAVDPLPRADVYELPYNQVRKMACSFGWDWGPVTATAGLWRPVVLEAWGGPRLEEVRLAAGWDGAVGAGSLRLTAAVAVPDDALDPADADDVADPAGTTPAALVVRVDGVPVATLPVTRDARGGRVAVGEVVVPGVVPWQPVGLGEQVLHDVALELVTGTAAGTAGPLGLDATGPVVLDRTERRVGFRDVRVHREADDAGESFELHVNGRRVWVRGFNWIPPHVTPEVVPREHLRHLLTEAVAAGANLLRVWGGGVLESEDLYDLCDELGLLVWQDFPFACAAYPEDPVTWSQVAAEVRDAVVRLGHRASLALWCGGNENLWGHEDWGWKEALDGRAWGHGYYHRLLPELLAELDGSRPYVPGSPFSPGGESGDPHPNDPSRGTTHHWDTWNELDYTAFDTLTSRFAAEFGWQAPASWPVLVRALGGAPTGADDARLPRLQKAWRGMENLGRGVAAHLPEPTDGRSWFLATQLVQARAVRAAIGRFRSLHDTCSGAVWWQLDDDWPALSWSVLDVAGRRKLSWYAMREVLSPRAALPTAADDGAAITLVNDTDEAWRAALVVHAVALADGVLGRQEREVVVPAQGHAVVRWDGDLPAGADAVVVDADGRRAARWLRPDLELGTPSAAVTVRVAERSAGGAGENRDSGPAATVVLEVTADAVVRDLVLLAETHPRLPDVVVDEQLLTLLPGETARLTVRAARAAELTDAEWAGMLAHAGPLEASVHQA
nr:glycoside hydrolase family 2 protein [uncultured Actinotalea sp.]